MNTTQVWLSDLTPGDRFRDRAGREQVVTEVIVAPNPFTSGNKVTVYVESGQHVRTPANYKVWSV